MPYNAKAVANFFLDLANSEGKPLTQMKLQKLVYFAHGWHLGLTGQPLLDEEIQAWSFGPVVRSLYNEFREFGSAPITRAAEETEFLPSPKPLTFTFKTTVPRIDDNHEEDADSTKRLLGRVWDVYSPFTAIQLSNITHAPETPWDRVRQDHGGRIPKYATIPDEYIKGFFRPKGGLG